AGLFGAVDGGFKGAYVMVSISRRWMMQCVWRRDSMRRTPKVHVNASANNTRLRAGAGGWPAWGILARRICASPRPERRAITRAAGQTVAPARDCPPDTGDCCDLGALVDCLPFELPPPADEGPAMPYQRSSSIS